MKRLKKDSIIRKVLVVMIFILILQASIFCGTIMVSGVEETLQENSFEEFSDRVIKKGIFLENQMNSNWNNIGNNEETINQYIINKLASQGLTTEDLNSDTKISNEILMEVSEDIIKMQRQTNTTGAFILFNSKENKGTDLVKKEGFYIKDVDPIKNPYNNEDLKVEVGSQEVIDNLKLQKSISYSDEYLIKKSSNESNFDFIYKPIEAAKINKTLMNKYKNLGYWSKNQDDMRYNDGTMVYSLPLINKNGDPYGVVGISIDLNYVNALLMESEFNNEVSYVTTIINGNSINDNTIVGGQVYNLKKNAKSIDFITNQVYKNTYTIKNTEGKSDVMYGNVRYLNLYKSSSPFSNEKWAIVGLSEKNSLFQHINKLFIHMFVTIALSTIIGIIAAFILGRKLTTPIINLAKTVSNYNPRKPLKLNKINILEIDELSAAITDLSARTLESASKLTHIIDLLNMPIGAFEYEKGKENVYCTKGFFKVLGIENYFKEKEDEYIDSKTFESIMEELKKNRINDYENIYRVINKNDNDKYIKINSKTIKDNTFGILVDVTESVVEKRKIEYDRDHDSLTKLLNRAAFKRMVLRKINESNDGIAAIVMCDMDNLKFINDTYGHDCGDMYIKEASDILKEFKNYRGIISRRSGDEFLVLIYGYENKDEIRKIVRRIHKKMKETLAKFTNEDQLRLRSSMGIAWYPDDSTDYETLTKYADFAMYKVKHTVKGNIMEFNKDEYSEDSFLLSKTQELNKLIDEQLVTYAFQPIVDAHTRKIFAYEALMRPKLESIKSPFQIISLATAESKLYEIEKLTWFKALETFADNKEKFVDAKLFINSIPNYVLSDEDAKIIEEKYGKYFERLVVELLENEKSNSKNTKKKRELLERWNTKLAIDDFGSGYNNDATLLEITPDFVKIDMEIIRGIDKDKNRQEITKNLVSYAALRNIKIIAEGVETQDEVNTLMEIGIDYFQGYYFGKPEEV